MVWVGASGSDKKPFVHRLVHTRLDLRVAALVAETLSTRLTLNPKPLDPEP